eukprot:superscaffoldBa00003319_g16651
MYILIEDLQSLPYLPILTQPLSTFSPASGPLHYNLPSQFSTPAADWLCVPGSSQCHLPLGGWRHRSDALHSASSEEAWLEVQVSNVTVKDYIFTVCLFRPDTSYIVRLRHRYRGPASSWSPWSNAHQGRTGEGEGVKPMERYSVSVKALYGKRGVGQNGTHLIYTRQGAPSAGPTVQVQRISGSTVELRWSPVPVELRHGFIRNYTLCYTTANQPTRRQFVPGHVHSYSLKNLSPGNYKIYIQANTVAGTGPAGRIASVHIGSEEISVVMGGVLPVLMTSLVLVLMACLAQNKRMKQKLCRDFPDPSNSSLAHWTPKTTLENMKQPAVPETPEIKYSEVILLDKSDLQDLDQDFSYQGICNIQAYTSHSDSPLPVSVAETPQNTPKFEKIYTGSSTTSCPSIYSGVVFSQTPPAPILCPSYLQSNYWQQSTVSVNDSKLQLEEDSELPVSIQAIGSDSPPSQTDEVKTFFLRQHQSPVSFSDFNNIFHSSVLLSHPVEVTSPQRPFSRSHFDSVPLLQPDILTLPDCRSDTPATSFSPFPQSVFVDFSYCPVECDPYISSNV